MTELYTLTIHEAGDLLRQKKISSVELTQAHLDRIRAVDDKVKAFTLVTDELALQTSGRGGPTHRKWRHTFAAYRHSNSD